MVAENSVRQRFPDESRKSRKPGWPSGRFGTPMAGRGLARYARRSPQATTDNLRRREVERRASDRGYFKAAIERAEALANSNPDADEGDG